MKLLLTLVVLVGFVQSSLGIDCYDCTESSYDGESGRVGNCFVTTSSTPSGTCPSSSGSAYCRTAITIQDGVTTDIVRSCANTGTDEDIYTTNVPGDKCITTGHFTSNPTDKTVCYYHCNTDNCNTRKSSGLNPCGSFSCNHTTGGYCDYLTGQCACNLGYSGNNCTTADPTPTLTPLRKCVQCNSETDSSCVSSQTSTDCPSSQLYCSTSTTTVYTTAGAALKTVTTRGCTNTRLTADECAFTDIYSDKPLYNLMGYKEITCFSTCDSDGCNTNTANGVVDGNEVVPMYCVQCSDTGSCATTTSRTICPTGTTHCKATVTYLIHKIVDLHHEATPAYRVQSIVRECATASVTRECTEETFAGANGVKQVTCTETCNTDGCNYGWPARPKCIQCESSSSEYDKCLEDPAYPSMCDYPYQEYCVAMESGIPKNNRRDKALGFRHRISRRCSHYSYGTGCTTSTVRNVELDQCNYTCTSDGCNEGTSGSVRVVSKMIYLLLPILLSWIAQL